MAQTKPDELHDTPNQDAPLRSDITEEQKIDIVARFALKDAIKIWNLDGHPLLRIADDLVKRQAHPDLQAPVMVKIRGWLIGDTEPPQA